MIVHELLEAGFLDGDTITCTGETLAQQVRRLDPPPPLVYEQLGKQPAIRDYDAAEGKLRVSGKQTRLALAPDLTAPASQGHAGSATAPPGATRR